MKKMICLWIAVVLLLSGCNMRTVNEMYYLPKRSEAYANLQKAIDNVMNDLEYSAPVSGVYRQTVQMADLDGDKKQEYILFAKGGTDKPLHIFIFSKENDEFQLVDRIACSGTDFEQIEYIRLDDQPGYEMVVGCQISNDVLRSVSVFSMVDGKMNQIMTANYHKFICADLNEDGLSELMILRPGSNEGDNGVAEFYRYHNGTVHNTVQRMSKPVSKLKRIMVGILSDGVMAAFVASETETGGMITDIYAFVNDSLTNITQADLDTTRDCMAYAEDIQGDGVVEMPNLLPMKLPYLEQEVENSHLLSWIAISSDGTSAVKQYTYHDYDRGWYFIVPDTMAERYAVEKWENSYDFYIWNHSFNRAQKIFTLYAITGIDQDNMKLTAGQFVVKQTDSVVYIGELDSAAATYSFTQEYVIGNFRMIQKIWNTGET